MFRKDEVITLISVKPICCMTMTAIRMAKLCKPCHISAANSSRLLPEEAPVIIAEKRKLFSSFLLLRNMATRVQVVELPREGPEQALKLFGGLPNLRLLVIGGDGTVAWILSCIDSIQVQALYPLLLVKWVSTSSCASTCQLQGPHRHQDSTHSQNLFVLTLYIKILEAVS